MKERIEALEKELAALKACQKYEFEPGNFTVQGYGAVGYKLFNGTKLNSYTYVGRCFNTEKKAYKARDIMVKHDIILKYVIDHAPDYDPDWGGIEKNYCVTYHTDNEEWHVRDNDYLCDLGTIFMPYWVAEKLADDLNNNRIEGM